MKSSKCVGGVLKQVLLFPWIRNLLYWDSRSFPETILLKFGIVIFLSCIFTSLSSIDGKDGMGSWMKLVFVDEKYSEVWRNKIKYWKLLQHQLSEHSWNSSHGFIILPYHLCHRILWFPSIYLDQLHCFANNKMRTIYAITHYYSETG